MKLSRRDFLKASGGAAGLLLLQSPAPAKAASQTQGGVGMLIDVTKCISCWWCYAACKKQNSLPETVQPDPADPPQLSPQVWSTLKPVKQEDGWHSRKHACNHCTDAACVSVCPTGALSYNNLGFVQYNKEQCSGCGYCTEFCPFGVPQLHGDKATGTAIMDKCTFCIDRVTEGEQPACAAACPTGAIKFGQRADLVREGNERVATLRRSNPAATFYGESELGGLHIMYVLDDAPEVYGLPAAPETPAPVLVRDILKWVGVGATVAVIAGFGLNYIIAREGQKSQALPGEEYMRKSKGKKP